MTTVRGNAAQQAKKRAFLAAYAETATVLHAATAAGVDRTAHYRWMQSDPEYAAAFEAAGESAIERLEREAVRRAAEGTEEPVYHQGKVVGHVRKYSDVLLIFLLKAARPDKYRDNVRMEHSGPEGGPIAIIGEGRMRGPE